MSIPIELNYYGLWFGKQTAKGTPNVTPTHRLAQIGGDFNAPRTDGRAQYSDLSKYGAFHDWIDTLVGNGTPQVEATPEETAAILWAHHGGESTSAIVGPPAKTKHTFTPQPGLGYWCTFFKRLGQTQIQRHQYNDCMVGQVQLDGAQSAKNVRITPTVVSLDPAVIYGADPAAGMPTKRPYLYTDGTSTFTIDTVVTRGHTSFTIVLNENPSPLYSDDVVVYDLMQADPSATLSVTQHFDADGLAQWNKLVYGATAPATGTKPLHSLPALGSYSFDLQAKDTTGVFNGDEFKFTVPAQGVKWAVPDSPGPNPAGGQADVTLAGELRPVAGSPLYTIDVSCDAAAFTT